MKLNFVFKSPDHIRYENSKHISGPHGGASRVIKVEPASDYIDNYIVTIFNSDGNHPLWQNNVQMSPKQMKVIEKYSNKIVLRGWGNDTMGASFANYGLIINFQDNQILNCILRLHDRNVDVKYLSQYEIDNLAEYNFDNNIEQKNKNGVFVEKKVDGEKIEWTYINNIKHGEWRMYFSNGKIKEIGNINNGIPDGEWRAFNINGTLRAVGRYERGLQFGLWKFNDEDGTLRAQGNYINGHQKGKWIYYDVNGEIEDSEIF